MADIEGVTVYGSNKWSDLKPLKLDDEDLVTQEWEKFYAEKYYKKQIVLHHTVSGPGTTGDLITWKKYKSSIATCVILERDGKIQQLFSSKFWAYHLGAGNYSLDKHSIGLELDNWGGLTKGNGKQMLFGKRKVNTIDGAFYATYGNKVNVPITYYENGFRGYDYYESYTDKQIRSLGELLLLWNKTYNIPLTYNEDMWDVSQRALNGEPGVWSHVSYRGVKDKQDCHPQPELKAMLRTIAGLV